MVIVEAQLHIVQNRQLFEEPDVLEGSGDPFFVDLNSLLAGDVFSVPDHLACVWFIHDCEQVEYGGLAGAVWPDQAIELLLLNGEVEAVHRPQSSEGDSQVFYI